MVKARWLALGTCAIALPASAGDLLITDSPACSSGEPARTWPIIVALVALRRRRRV